MRAPLLSALALASACTGHPTPSASNPLGDDATRSLTPAPIVSECGAPVLDGVLSPGEWEDAIEVRFAAVRPESAGGGEIPGSLRAMTDDRNIYLAIRLDEPVREFTQDYVVNFDSDPSGGLNAGDDFLWVQRVLPWGEPDSTVIEFHDGYYSDCTTPTGPGLCMEEDTTALDDAAAGTVDGGAALTFDATSTVVEMWHPYRGGDARDLVASAEDWVPLRLDIELIGCGDWPSCWGGLHGQLVDYRDLVIGCGAPLAERVIPIRIGSTSGEAVPTIQLSSGGTTSVAILGTPTFAVAYVDPSTVYFAGAPVLKSDDGSWRASMGDANDDGLWDLIVQVDTARLQLTEASTDGTLAGRTLSGEPFKGTDSVKVLP